MEAQHTRTHLPHSPRDISHHERGEIDPWEFRVTRNNFKTPHLVGHDVQQKYVLQAHRAPARKDLLVNQLVKKQTLLVERRRPVMTKIKINVRVARRTPLQEETTTFFKTLPT